MATPHRAYCKTCRKHRDEVGRISWAGYCREHGKAAMNSNVDQMHAKRGPNFTAWRSGMIRCAGGHFAEQKVKV